MEAGGAYGGGKAGAAFDPITFVQRPQVILRALSWLFAIIVFGCISSQGWRIENGQNYCLYNGDAFACKYGTTIGVIGFLAAMVFLVGEFMFERMSSVKSRKHFVLGDLAFSAFWAFMFFITFCYLWNQWSKAAPPPAGYGVNNVQAAIAFSFFSIITWGGSAYFAYKRYTLGAEAAFAPSFESDPAANAYSSYPVGNEPDTYNQAPFSGQQQPSTDYQAPTY
ncbi:synaptogyrin isoform X2 [Hermetia illucens]|uniref:synaptogyrin isoform X2 n=1 Tax=Hermetia illucens TaxID=343691 RepID=UPI0018CC37FB|nr:synaptogyrin isoform X2 [Hermetia illucens]